MRRINKRNIKRSPKRRNPRFSVEEKALSVRRRLATFLALASMSIVASLVAYKLVKEQRLQTGLIWATIISAGMGIAFTLHDIWRARKPLHSSKKPKKSKRAKTRKAKSNGIRVDVKEPGENSSTPPIFIESLVWFILPKADREYLVGDMREGFAKWVIQYGRTRACAFYIKDAITTAYPVVLKLLAKLGILTWLGETIRSRFH